MIDLELWRARIGLNHVGAAGRVSRLVKKRFKGLNRSYLMEWGVDTEQINGVPFVLRSVVALVLLLRFIFVIFKPKKSSSFLVGFTHAFHGDIKSILTSGVPLLLKVCVVMIPLLLLLAGDVERNPGPTIVTEDKLDGPNGLINLLDPIAAKWDIFIVQLGMPFHKVEQVTKDCASRGEVGSQACLVRSLHLWVKSDKNPTYETIVEVLKGNMVPNRPLAERVEQFFKGGSSGQDSTMATSPTSASPLSQNERFAQQKSEEGIVQPVKPVHTSTSCEPSSPPHQTSTTPDTVLAAAASPPQPSIGLETKGLVDHQPFDKTEALAMHNKLKTSFTFQAARLKNQLKAIYTVPVFRDGFIQELPCSVRDEHEKFFLSKSSEISRAMTFDELFIYLDTYWDYLNYTLLEGFIDIYGTEKMQEDMESYVKDLEDFRRKTKLSVFLQLERHKIRRKAPPGFSQFVAKYCITRESTLEDIENLRLEFTDEFQLRKFALLVIDIIEGCVIITWCVPSSVIGLLKEGLGKPEVLAKLHIDSVEFFDEVEQSDPVGGSSRQDSTMATSPTSGSSLSGSDSVLIDDESDDEPDEIITLRDMSGDRLPYLETSGLTREEVDALKRRLIYEKITINYDFLRFFMATQKSFENNHSVQVSDLADQICVLDIYPQITDGTDNASKPQSLMTRQNEILAATTVREIFEIIKIYVSFFNFELIEHLIQQLGTKEDKERLAKYEAKFKDFCKRRVSEWPQQARGRHDNAIVVRIEDDFHSYTLEAVKLLKHKLCEILEVPLVFRRVKKGHRCTELEFLVLSSKALELPLTKRQQEQLQSINVLKLTYGDYFFISNVETERLFADDKTEQARKDSDTLKKQLRATIQARVSTIKELQQIIETIESYHNAAQVVQGVSTATAVGAGVVGATAAAPFTAGLSFLLLFAVGGAALGGVAANAATEGIKGHFSKQQFEKAQRLLAADRTLTSEFCDNARTVMAECEDLSRRHEVFSKETILATILKGQTKDIKDFENLFKLIEEALKATDKYWVALREATVIQLEIGGTPFLAYLIPINLFQSASESTSNLNTIVTELGRNHSKLRHLERVIKHG